MASELLLNWYNGRRNFTVGKVLYERLGGDETIKKQLSIERNEYSETILLKAIESLINGSVQKQAEAVISVHDEMPEADDTVLQALRSRWMPAFTEMNYKRHELDRLLDEVSDAAALKRCELARDILNLEKQCIAVWKERDYYQKHQTLPGKSQEKEAVADPYLKAKHEQNLKVYIRRYRAALAKKPGDARAAELLTQYTNELNQLTAAHE